MHRRTIRILVLLCALSIAAAACGSSGGGGTTTVKKGGTITVGAEQWASCLNPINQCANASWLHWTVLQYVLPKLMYLDQKNNFKPSALLTEAPTTLNGGIATNPFKLTFNLNPAAVWNDKSPITCDDVNFTWQAYLHTTGTISTVGYDQIKSIDCSNKQKVVITFKKVFADWADLLGGNSAYILKKAAFPGGPNVGNAMKTTIPFSGGPWILKSWDKNSDSLIRNDNYWDAAGKPILDQVNFKPLADQDTEIAQLKTGEVVAIYPQPSPGFSKKLATPNIKVTTGAGQTIEGFWFNLKQKPLDDLKVRQAFSYGVDRQALIDTVIKPDDPNAKVLNCEGTWVEGSPWCNDGFADVSYQPDKAKQILQSDGYTLGADGYFTKGGKTLDLEFNTVQGNHRREAYQQLVIAEEKKAGIKLHVKNYDKTTLFDTVIPHLHHTVAIYAQTASSDPSVTSIFACDQIPSAANQYAGQNDDAWCNQQASTLEATSDAQADPTARAATFKQIGALIRQDQPWLPLIQLGLIVAWRTDKVAGPVDDYVSGAFSAYYNINKWHLV